MLARSKRIPMMEMLLMFPFSFCSFLPRHRQLPVYATPYREKVQVPEPEHYCPPLRNGCRVELLDLIAEFCGDGVDYGAEESVLSFARNVAGDNAAAAFAFEDEE